MGAEKGKNLKGGRGGRTEIGCKEDLEDLRKAGKEWHSPSSPLQDTEKDEVRKQHKWREEVMLMGHLPLRPVRKDAGKGRGRVKSSKSCAFTPWEGKESPLHSGKHKP